MASAALATPPEIVAEGAVTRFLRAVERREESAFDRLFDRISTELRAVAAGQRQLHERRHWPPPRPPVGPTSSTSATVEPMTSRPTR